MNNAKVIKEMCKKLHKAHKENGGKKSYIEIVDMVMKTRFGALLNNAPLEEIGEVFGVTRERVRQIENQAIRKLKNPDSIANKKLREYVLMQIKQIHHESYVEIEG